jgi:hypothetical protein
MADHFQLNLGSLRSTITLTLHTHHAARLWQGRLAREGSHPIMSMAAYINITNILKQAAAQDDPFADWFMLMLEDKVLRAKAQMGQLMEQVSHLEKLLPSQIDVGDNLNIHPVTLPLFIGSQLGFLAVYLLTDYDTLAAGPSHGAYRPTGHGGMDRPGRPPGAQLVWYRPSMPRVRRHPQRCGRRRCSLS